MRKDHRSTWAAVPVAMLLIAVLAGCSQQQLDGFMPGERGTTDKGDLMMTFWVNSWIILLVVGLITWGLLIWAAVVYRRRRNDTGLPKQMRYHQPMEVFFTVVPIILVAGFFAFTARDQAIVEQNFAADQASAVAGQEVRDVHIEVYGKQWAWDFNYLDVAGSPYDGGVYTQGIQAQEERDENDRLTGEIEYEKLPVLMLPVGANVTLDLKSRDVAHSFWVPDFHYKEDTIPGKTNQYSFVPEREGVYIGKCAELCGEYHSMMLFEVHVVSEAEYNEYIQSLRDAGNVGAVGDEGNRNDNLPGTEAPDFSEHDESK
ncbi:cytochrome c oxidase subunit 2 [Pseudoclavibacter chungangensis]|uniref:aa3-type cytochrome oxidase subunit II n=1 Tax=Pseudoclavibacter chungangensis TaxID=587635 RepID=UPI0017C82CCA|nr:cytochrome c oxidase subunit II [Pseudoclavibacter chungangensis]NYJ66770.1 cytochrome c oxidase subunit 2 [Pseudoclavibacter chungangensis]